MASNLRREGLGEGSVLILLWACGLVSSCVCCLRLFVSLCAKGNESSEFRLNEILRFTFYRMYPRFFGAKKNVQTSSFLDLPSSDTQKS